MQLHYRELSTDSNLPPLVMMHGLFGSSANLMAIGKAFSLQRTVLLPDMRNHGRSPHDEDVSYQAMAQDILELIDQLGYQQVDLLGHSMGGKAAMWLALNHAERINHLIVADISPVQYPNRFEDMLLSLGRLDLQHIESRQDADEALSGDIEEKSLRDYLLQNLIRTDGKWQWRMNLVALTQHMHLITGFPDSSDEYAKPALFLKGEHSAYLADKYLDDLYRFFPLAEIHEIADAGHWLYAEQPNRFMDAIRSFCCR